jgi:hypothetical protein
MRFCALLALLFLAACTAKQASERSLTASSDSPNSPPRTSESEAKNEQARFGAPAEETEILAHDVILREGPDLQLKVRWMRGTLARAHPGVTPSLDDPRSFTIAIQDGVVAASLPDLAGLLNSSFLQGTSLKAVKLRQQGKQLKLQGTFHKGVELPVEILADVAASPDRNHIRVHIAKLKVLEIPIKGLLDTLHISPAEVFDPKKTKGIEMHGDDLDISASEILPPPRTTGPLSDVHLSPTGDLVEIYGSARGEVQRFKQWRNFIRLRGGDIALGKLTMNHADILVVDTSQSDWFNFDFSRYAEQIVNGQVRLTPDAGLQIFAPDINKLPKTAANQHIRAEWMRNRNTVPALIP